MKNNPKMEVRVTLPSIAAEMQAPPKTTAQLKDPAPPERRSKSPAKGRVLDQTGKRDDIYIYIEMNWNIVKPPKYSKIQNISVLSSIQFITILNDFK